MRYSNFDENGLIFGSGFDDLAIGEDLVNYFRKILVVGFGDRFLLARSHYLSNYIEQ